MYPSILIFLIEKTNIVFSILNLSTCKIILKAIFLVNIK
jgi:hypothetical protein